MHASYNTQWKNFYPTAHLFRLMSCHPPLRFSWIVKVRPWLKKAILLIQLLLVLHTPDPVAQSRYWYTETQQLLSWHLSTSSLTTRAPTKYTTIWDKIAYSEFKALRKPCNRTITVEQHSIAAPYLRIIAIRRFIPPQPLAVGLTHPQMYFHCL